MYWGDGVRKFVLILMFLLLPISVSAYHEITNPNCTIDLKNSLRTSAFEIIYSNEKYIDSGVVYYKLSVRNISANLSMKDLDSNIIYNNDFSLNRIVPGTIRNFQIFANSKTPCEGYNVYTKIVSIPYFNKYSLDPLCEGYEDYVLCKEDSKINLTYEQFEDAINEYIESVNRPEPEEIIDDNKIEKKNFFKDVLKFLYNNYVTILVSIIIVGTICIVIILLVKRRKYKF